MPACTSVSMPSTTVLIARRRATSTVACTNTQWCSLLLTWDVKLRSIFTTSTGKWCRHASDA